MPGARICARLPISPALKPPHWTRAPLDSGRLTALWPGPVPGVPGVALQPCMHYLVQEVLQVADPQGQQGQPLWLCGIELCEDGLLASPVDALFQEVELINEAQDVFAGTQGGAVGPVLPPTA